MNLSLRAKLLWMGASVVGGMITVGVLGLVASNKLSGSFEEVAANRLPLTRNISLIDMVHDGVRGSVFKMKLALAEKNKENFTEAVNELAEYRQNSDELFDGINKLVLPEDFKSRMNESKRAMDEYFSVAKKIGEAGERFDIEKVRELNETFQIKFKELETTLENNGDFILKNTDQLLNDKKAEGHWYKLTLLVVLLLTLVFGLVVTLFTNRSIQSALEAVSSDLFQGASEVGSMANVLSNASLSLSSSSHEQTSALQETAASVEEISSMVAKSTENASHAESASLASKTLAEEGGQIVKKMVETIQSLDSTNRDFIQTIKGNNDKIEELVRLIQEIDLKTKVINDIVFQTKLLSFNASVEAARAGEHGKGFAVVAEEVGNLAALSGNAAKEISSLLENSVEKVKTVVRESRDQVNVMSERLLGDVEKSVEQAQQCGRALESIVKESGGVSETVKQVSQASSEQSHGIQEISKAMHQLNEATHINAKSASSCASASQALTNQVEQLSKAAQSLQKVITGKEKVSEFIWKSEYELGVDDMDEEHKTLVSKINALAKTLEAGKSSISGQKRTKVLQAFRDMASYTITHFRNEERLLLDVKYPDFEAHKMLHTKLLDAVGKFESEIQQGTADPARLSSFLNDWLLRHILGVDMKYARFIKGEGDFHLSPGSGKSSKTPGDDKLELNSAA